MYHHIINGDPAEQALLKLSNDVRYPQLLRYNDIPMVNGYKYWIFYEYKEKNIRSANQNTNVQLSKPKRSTNNS